MERIEASPANEKVGDTAAADGTTAVEGSIAAVVEGSIAAVVEDSIAARAAIAATASFAVASSATASSAIASFAASTETVGFAMASITTNREAVNRMDLTPMLRPELQALSTWPASSVQTRPWGDRLHFELG